MTGLIPEAESNPTQRDEKAGSEMVTAPASARRKPRLKPVDRAQMLLRPVDVEDLVEPEHSARAIWALVGQLDLARYHEDIAAVEGVAGRSTFDPRMLISLWIYAYSQGVGSAREVSRLCEYHPAYQWLTGLQAVNHHTLSDFRVAHQEALDELFTQLLGVLSAEGLIRLQRVMHDGTKIKASAAGDSFRREDRLRAHLALAKEQVAQMGDPESEQLSQRVAKARERMQRERKQRLEQALEELKAIRKTKPAQEQKEARASWSDPQARIMKQPDHGYAPSYNVQLSTDAAAKVIVGVEVTQAASDQGELPAAVERIEARLGRRPEQVVVDGGFITHGTIVKMDEQAVDLIGPMSEQAQGRNGRMKVRGVTPEFFPDAFRYDSGKDCYYCPAGQRLKHRGKENRDGELLHRYCAKPQDCRACKWKAQCCPQNATAGRSIVRRESDPVVRAFKARMQSEAAKAIYKERGPVAEFPNAWIKEKFKLRQFSVRGLNKVKMESLWAALTYNIAQWIRLCWRPRQAVTLTG